MNIDGVLKLFHEQELAQQKIRDDLEALLQSEWKEIEEEEQKLSTLSVELSKRKDVLTKRKRTASEVVDTLGGTTPRRGRDGGGGGQAGEVATSARRLSVAGETGTLSLDAAWNLVATPNGVVEHGTILKRPPASTRVHDCVTRGEVGWSSGVHEWSVKLTKGSGCVILGVVTVPFALTNADGNDDKHFAINCCDGTAYDNIGNLGDAGFSVPVPPGGFGDNTIINVRLDMEKRMLQFGLNDRWNDKPTFFNLPEGPFYPYFALHPRKSSDVIIQVISSK